MQIEKQKPVPTKEDYARIASSIRTAAEMGAKLKQCGLSRRAILVLLSDATGLPMKDCKLVIEAAADLAKLYLA